MSEFVMGARLNLVDDFSNPIRDAVRAVNEFRQAITGINSEASRMSNEARNMNNAQRDVTRSANQASDAMDDMSDSTREMSDNMQDADQFIERVDHGTNVWSASLRGMKTMLLGAAAAVGTFMAANQLKDFAMDAIETAASMKAMSSQFDQVFKGMEAQATSTMASLEQKTGMLEGRLKGSFIQMAAFAKTTGMDTKSALALSERATLAAADSAAFYDRSIEEVSENLQSFLKGNYENDAALGISATEFTRNAAAMKEYGKKFTELSEAQKQLTLLKMVEDGNKLSGAMGQAANEADAYENVMGNLKQTWAEFKAQVGGPLLQPFVDGVMSATKWIQGFDVGKIVQGIETAKDVAWTLKETFMSLLYDTGEVSDLWQMLGVPPEIADRIEQFANLLKDGVVMGIQAAKGAFDIFKESIGWASEHMNLLIPLVSSLASGFVAFKILTAVSIGFKALRTALVGYKAAILGSTLVTRGFTAAIRANPIGAAVTAIMLLVGAGVLLYRNWDKVKAKTLEVWGMVKAWFVQTFASIKTGFNTFVATISALWSQFSTWIGSVMQSGLEVLKSIWSFVWMYLSAPVQILVGYVKLIISNFMAVIKGIFAAGMALLQGDWQGAWDIIKGTGETILNNIMAFFEGIDLFKTGKQIIQGLIDGIGSMVDAAANKVKEVAGGIKDAVTGFFQIHSPSRLFRYEVGQQLGAGLLLGMDDSKKGLMSAATSMAEAAMIPSNAVQEMQTTARVATSFDGAPVPNYAGGTSVPAAGNTPTAAGSGNVTTIDTLIGKIELVASPDVDAQALLEQFMKLLYERLRQAKDILSGGDKGALL